MVAEILKIVLPAFIVFLTAYFVIKQLLLRDHENKKVEIILRNQKVITPIRLQAYERVILFLERIGPNHLVMRVQRPQMNVSEMQLEMLSSIRTEFEHNLSQQLYISPESWELVRNAKESIVKLINTCAAEQKPNANAMLLVKEIFDKLIEMDKAPNQAAIDALKKEISQMF